MSISQALLTMLGGFLLPFVALMIWGRLVARWKVWGVFFNRHCDNRSSLVN